MAKNENKTALKKGQAKFQLIGEAKINDFTFKLDQESQNSDWVYHTLNLGVDCGNGNAVYADMMGGYGSERDNVIYVHGKKENDNGKMIDDYENQFTIAWEDRFDENILETIGNNCFITVGLEKDEKDKTFVKKFLSEYDAIEYIKDNLEDGMVINVKGDLAYNYYNENIYTKKTINSIFASKIDDSDKYKATFIQTILLHKDSIGKLDKEKAVYPIDAYVVEYVGKIGNQKIKENVVFNRSFELEVDRENPENTKKFLNKIFKVRKDIVEVTVEGDIIEGQSLVSITEDDIPDDIKELIDMGAYTLEDALSKLAVGGSKEKRMVIRRPQIKMVGKDDDKKPVIMIDKDKYKENDMTFIGEFLLIDDEEDAKNNENESITDDEENDDDMDWLQALDDEE